MPLSSDGYVYTWDAANNTGVWKAPSGVLTDVSFGTPSVKVALTFDPGTAGTALRSDARLALDTTIAPTMTGVWTFNAAPVFNSAPSMAALTASRVVITDGSKNLASSGVTTTALSYVANLTSDAQAQLNACLQSSQLDDDVTLTANSSTRVSSQHAVKTYVDNQIAGLKFKLDVIAASTANVSISSAPSALDGVTLTAGDRVLLKNQTTASQNGVYIFNGAAAALTRATDGDTGAELVSATFPVRAGTTNQDTWWTCTNDTITLGTTALTFTQTGGAGTYVAGAGLTLTGNSFSISTGGVTNAMLAGSIAASKLVGVDISTVGTITTGTWQATPVGIAYGGTGATTALAAFNALSPLTTRGDLLTRNATDNARLALSVPAANVLNVLGVANGESDPSWKAVLDATNPATLSTGAASPGTSLVFAHRDHVHAVTTTSVGAASTILATDASGNTTLANLFASGSTFNLVNAVPTTVNFAGAATTINVGAATGTLTLNNATVAHAGTLISATVGYNTDIGQLSKKFKSLYVAELVAETLVAQDTLATLGGRVLIGPTTQLTADVAAADTTITVKHNNLSSGDRVRLEAQGKLEYMAITSGPTATGSAYSYNVTRNLDGTGANTWNAGDAVFNTGQAGNGHWDLFSLNSSVAITPDYVFDSGAATNLNQSSNYSLFGDGANALNGAMYFGIANTNWQNLYFNLSTAASYVATLTWEYWNGSAWTAFTPAFVGNTNGDFKQIGWQGFEWSALSLTGWTTTTVFSQSAYWVRVRVSAFTSWATLPVQSRRVYWKKGQIGPTQVLWKRNSSAWDDVTEHAAFGELVGFYGYTASTVGIALGEYAAGKTHVTIDSANGYRTINGLSTVVQQIDAAGNITVGQVGTGLANTYISAGALSIRLNTTALFNVDTSGNVTFGQVATSNGNAYWNNSNKRLEFRGGTGGTVVQAYIDTTGAIASGSSGNVTLSTSGIVLKLSNTSADSVTWADAAGTTSYGYVTGNFVTGSTAEMTVEAQADTTANAPGVFLYASNLHLAATTNRRLRFELQYQTGLTNSYAFLGGATSFSGLRIDGAGLTSGAASPTPSAMLDVRGGGLFTASVNGVHKILLENTSNGSSAFASMQWKNDAGNLGVIFMNGSANTGYGGANSLILNNSSNNPLCLGTNDTVRVTVSNTGNLRFHAYGAGTLTTDASGNVTASSDETLKDVRAPFTSGLDVLRQIEPITFRWKKATGWDTANDYHGFSAQNVARALPGAVGRNADGTLTLQERPLLAATVNAVKEVDAEVGSLRAEVAALRAEVAALKAARGQ